MAAFVSDLALVWTLALGTATFSLCSCRSPEARACSEQYAVAQQRVRAVDSKAKASVSDGLKAVETALAACRSAGGDDFVEQLTKAKNELRAQLDVLDRRARHAPRRAPSAEELQKLEKDGDPSCPRGQAYRPEGAKEIRCTGPQLVDMTLSQADAHFRERDYRVKRIGPATLDAEHGSERATLIYPASAGAAAPDCVILVPAPGTSWQEAVARATGANPARLEPGRAVASARGALPFELDEKNVVIRLGRCERR